MTLRDAALQLTAKLGEPRDRNIRAYLAELEATEGTTDRFRDLDRFERYYRGLQHDQKVADWDGRPYHKPGECGAVALATSLQKPIYRKASWRLRRPFVRKQGCGAIVDRFTGLLYGETTKPSICPTDKAAQPWVDAVLKASEWWGQWSLARTYGGATGAVAVGVQLYKGRILLDVVNAKWCVPRWVDDNPASGRLDAIEIRCIRPRTRIVQTVDPKTGAAGTRMVQENEQYVRIVDDQIDVVLTAPEKAKDGGWTVESVVNHSLGECPFVWVRNTRVLGDTDGAPDCDQQWDSFDAIDALLSGAFVGTAQNAEPTAYLKLNRQVGDGVQMGSGSSALELKTDEEAGYIETSGTGGEAAEKRARELWDSILEDVRCVLTEGRSAAGSRTATEMDKRSEAMFERADEFRRQYGDAMEACFEILMRLCRHYNYEGLPASVPVDCRPAMDDVSVEWPPYVRATPADKVAEITVFKTASEARFVSRKTAVERLAHVLGIEDTKVELALIATEDKERSAQYELLLGDPKPNTNPDDKPPAEAPEGEPEEEPEDDDDAPDA